MEERALDNIAIERYWRTLKQDEIYLHEYDTMQEARERINKFMKDYNSIRPHQSLYGKTPDMVYYGILWYIESGCISLGHPIKKDSVAVLIKGSTIYNQIRKHSANNWLTPAVKERNYRTRNEA